MLGVIFLSYSKEDNIVTKKVEVKTKDRQKIIGTVLEFDYETLSSFFDLPPIKMAGEGIWIQHDNKLSFITHDHILSMKNL